jgi:hypothetical protein
VLFKHGFGQPLIKYFSRYVIYTVVTLFAGVITQFASSIFVGNSVLNLIGRFMMCLMIPNLIFAILFFRSPEFNHLRGIAIAMITKILQKLGIGTKHREHSSI